MSGGSEAIETALKLARAYHLARGEPGRHVVISRRGSYHGNSRGALDVSGREPLRRPYLPWLGKSLHVAAAYPYRDTATGAQLAAQLDATIDEVGAHRVAAFVAEPIAGAALGASVPPDDYWPAVAEVCDAHGVLLVADEVMTGFGRTGAWFACDHWAVRPDILVAGKGASNGAWPLGLTIASGAVHDTVDAAGGFVHGFTWSHHPIGARVALAVLQRLRDDGLVERSAAAGPKLHALLARRARRLRLGRRRTRTRAVRRHRAGRRPRDEGAVPAFGAGGRAGDPGRTRSSGCSSTPAPAAPTAPTATSCCSARRSSSPTTQLEAIVERLATAIATLD